MSTIVTIAMSIVVLALVASCGPQRKSGAAPQGRGEYQVFAGALSDESQFIGHAWFDRQSQQRAFCVKVGESQCSAQYSKAAARGREIISFVCNDGRQGTAQSYRKETEGETFSYGAIVNMVDGAQGIVTIFAPEPWDGRDLCST